LILVTFSTQRTLRTQSNAGNTEYTEFAEDTEFIKRCLRHFTERLRNEKHGVSPLCRGFSLLLGPLILAVLFSEDSVSSVFHNLYQVICI